MSRTTKFLGSMLATSWSFEIDTAPPTGSPETVTIADGSWYLSGDGGSDDLLLEIQDGLDAAFVGLSTVDSATVAITSAGIVSIETDLDYLITWTTTGELLRDILRYSGATLSLPGAVVSGTRAARYFAHTDKPARVDIPSTGGRRSMDEADDGTVHGLDMGPIIRRYDVQVRYQGPFRTTVANGETEFADLFIYVIKPYRRIRWYPDDTVTTPWAELTNPWGYHVVKETELKAHKPARVIANWYSWLAVTYKFQVQP